MFGLVLGSIDKIRFLLCLHPTPSMVLIVIQGNLRAIGLSFMEINSQMCSYFDVETKLLTT